MSADGSQYPSRFDPAKKYQRVLFPPHEVHAHSHDFNDSEAILSHRMRRISDVIMTDGDVTRGGKIVVSVPANSATGTAHLEAGAVYAAGIVHDLEAATLTVPAVGTQYVGVCILSTVITHNEDPTLKGQVPGSRAHGEPGAARLKMEAHWAVEGSNACGGTFFRVYTLIDGRVITSDPPPVLTPINDALARYDREANGHYVVKGWRVTPLGYDGVANKQRFSISEGTINVWGYKRDLSHAIRLDVVEEPDVQLVDNEPHQAPTVIPSGGLRVFTNHGPVIEVLEVTVLKTFTSPVTHGPYSGIADPLWHDGVDSIVSVTQGGVTYVAGRDFNLVADRIDWSPTGSGVQEPAPGSTYNITYRYWDTLQPNELVAHDTKSVTVPAAGMTASSTVLIKYRWALPRIDAICVNRDGGVFYLKGQPQRYDPWPPRVPNDVILLAEVNNQWRSTPIVKNTRVQSIHKNELVLFGELIYDLFDLLAQERLKKNAEAKDVAAKRGVFVDPFLDDDMRDQGIAQTAAVVNQTLKLPINGGPESRLLGTLPYMLPYTEEVVMEQTFVTACMKINPYAVFAPLPGTMKLFPAVDFWVEHETEWTSPVTRVFDMGERPADAGGAGSVTVENITEVETRRRAAQRLRQIVVTYEIKGFGAGEILDELTFDGINITPA
jgi:Domain of unknown function (DUF4815)